MNLNDYEKEILESYEGNQLLRSKTVEEEIALAKQAAESYFNKKDQKEKKS